MMKFLLGSWSLWWMQKNIDKILIYIKSVLEESAFFWVYLNYFERDHRFRLFFCLSRLVLRTRREISLLPSFKHEMLHIPI
jgi:hypothetical protein